MSPFLKCIDLLAHALVLVEKVQRAQYGAVAYLAAQFGDAFLNLLGQHFAQHLAAKLGRNLLHLGGYGRVFGGQVGMVAARAHYYQRIALGCEVEVHVLHLRIGLAEVDGNESAQRAGRLIHKAGGLAKVHVLGILRDSAPFQGR